MVVDTIGAATLLSKRRTSATSSALRAATVIRTSNTGLPGAYKAPVAEPAPAPTSGRTLGRRTPAPPPPPVTSAQLPSAPAPSVPPPIVASGGGGADNGTGIFSPGMNDEPPTGAYVPATSSLLTPKNIALGVAALLGIVFVAKRL